MSWTELSCRCKLHSSKVMLLLGLSHRYKNSMVVITIWLTIAKYQYLNWQWIFSFLRWFFSFLYHRQFFYRTWLYTWVTWWVSFKKQELLTRREHLDSPLVFGGVRVAHLFSFLWYVLFFCFVCLGSVSCVPNITIVSNYPFLIAPFVFKVTCLHHTNISTWHRMILFDIAPNWTETIQTSNNTKKNQKNHCITIYIIKGFHNLSFLIR